MMLWARPTVTARPTVSNGSANLGPSPPISANLAANLAANLLLRVQRPCTAADCADSSAQRTLTQLFAPSWALGGLREVGLAGGPLPVAPSWAQVGSSSGASPTVPKKEERGGDFDDDEALEVRASERLDSMDCMLIASLINDLSQVRAFECTGLDDDLKHTVEAINEGGNQHAILKHTVEESVAGALGTAPRTAQVATAWQAQDSAQDSAKGSAGTVHGRPRTEHVPVAPALLWAPLAISLVLLAIMMLRRSSRWRSRSEMRSAAAMRVGGARRRIT